MNVKRLLWFAGIIILVILLVAGIVTWYQGLEDNDENLPEQNVVGNEVVSGTNNTYAQFSVEPVVEGLKVPWDIVFTSPERMLITERTGAIRQVVQGELREAPLIVFQEVRGTGEEGLMGMALDPEYDTNKFIYISYAYPDNNSYTVRVSRLIDNGNNLREEVLIDGIPAARNHAGSRIAFGPDNKLYITTGDALNAELAQDRESLAGKILRLNPDGSVPEDNPFPGSPVYSLGHRNPQGLDWHPVALISPIQTEISKGKGSIGNIVRVLN
ncbi:MAG: PQQ-dependent sugar dehydrogenase [Candidatus Dojkabacteria bacterium]